MHYFFSVASTGSAEKLGSLNGGVLESRIAGGGGATVDAPYGQSLRALVDRSHWAATETATHARGSQDGAVSAAHRAVQEVLKAA